VLVYAAAVCSTGGVSDVWRVPRPVHGRSKPGTWQSRPGTGRSTRPSCPSECHHRCSALQSCSPCCSGLAQRCSCCRWARRHRQGRSEAHPRAPLSNSSSTSYRRGARVGGMHQRKCPGCPGRAELVSTDPRSKPPMTAQSLCACIPAHIPSQSRVNSEGDAVH
jgi:hypothetical protein